MDESRTGHSKGGDIPIEGTPCAVDLFSTCPQNSYRDGSAYWHQVSEVSVWSEEAGCKGMLVYTDNSCLDPWLVSEAIIRSTKTLCPLVAVQPVYMHPYTVAKLVTSLAFLYGRRVYLNMVAGGFRNDLLALNDATPHDRRYDRLVEYATIIKDLLAGPAPVSLEGEFYRVEKLSLKPPLPPNMFPGIFMSGSSEPGLRAARALTAVAIEYPEPAGQYLPGSRNGDGAYGIRVGIIARDEEERAWEVAYQRFPEDRKGQISHQLAMKVSDSTWHKRFSDMRVDPSTLDKPQPYWLTPFQNYKTFCPYLVGSYQTVGHELARYASAGFRTFLVDIPAAAEDLLHIRAAFEAAALKVST